MSYAKDRVFDQLDQRDRELQAEGICPACERPAWTSYGCASCGEQPFPPSFTYQDYVNRVILVPALTAQPPQQEGRLTTPVHDEIVGWTLDFLKEYGMTNLCEEFPVPGKDPLTAPSVDVFAPERKLAFEIKSETPSCGELLRQIHRYLAAWPWCQCPVLYGQKMHSEADIFARISGRQLQQLQCGSPLKFDGRTWLHGTPPQFVVVSPDTRFLDRIVRDGNLFLEYPSGRLLGHDQPG